MLTEANFHPLVGGCLVVRLGAIDGDPGVRPGAHQFVADAASWEPIPDDGLPRHQGRIPLDVLSAAREGELPS